MKTTRLVLVAAAMFASVAPQFCFADGRAGESMGTIQFAVTGTKDAQEHVVHGVKLVHHMMYTEADHEFAAATRTDPNCALAYWGRAMVLIHPLWPDSPTEAERKFGAEQIQRGLACTSSTPRERAYLQTLDRYFNATVSGDHPARLQVVDPAWSELAGRFPEDLDALAFSALYHLAPARFATKDKSHRIQLEAAAQLQQVTAKIPDHPGAQHYKIHAYDFPLLADRALEVCDTYSSIAPDVPHALHMPTHIFTRRGLWDRSIEFNLRSSAAAQKLIASSGSVNSHFAHAMDYLAYAYLQRGQFRAAQDVRKKLAALGGPFLPMNPVAMAFAFAAVPARCTLERQAWSEAAVLPIHEPAAFPWGQSFLNCDSIIRFARAIGAARSGNLEAARTEIGELERIRADLTAGNRASYWASQAETQWLAARAWVLLAEKKTDEAIALMRQATETEAGTDKEAVTPGEVLPAGDLLGEMLSEAGRPSEALAAFEAVLASSPNRLNTLYGAAHAAEQLGDTVKALRYYQQVVAVAVAADPGIERVESARSFVTKAGKQSVASQR
ncbi:MAG: hypothetical protein ABIV50_01370 [Opitutus sp.]